jgi:hypothetical protein
VRVPVQIAFPIDGTENERPVVKIFQQFVKALDETIQATKEELATLATTSIASTAVPLPSAIFNQIP